MNNGSKKKSPEEIANNLSVGAAAAGVVGVAVVTGLIMANASKKKHAHPKPKSKPKHHETPAERRRREEDERAARQAREDKARADRQAREEEAQRKLLERQSQARIKHMEQQAREEQLREEKKERARLEQIRLDDEAQAHQSALDTYPRISDSTLNNLSVLTTSQSCSPWRKDDGKTLPYLVLEQGHVEAFVMLINDKKYKVNLEQSPYLNPLELVTLRKDAVAILNKIHLAVTPCSTTLFDLIALRFDPSMLMTMMSSSPSIDPILIWMMERQLLPPKGIDFLNRKATPSNIKSHFDVYRAFFEKYALTHCSTEIRHSYLTQHVTQKGAFTLTQLNTLYCQNKKPFDVGLLYDDLLCIPGQTPETVLATIGDLHKINRHPIMTFNRSFWQNKLSSGIGEAKKILNIIFDDSAKPSKIYLSTQALSDIVMTADQMIANKHQCAQFLMPLVAAAAKGQINTPILINIAQQTQDLSFSKRLLGHLPEFENLSDLRRALLPRLLDSNSVPDYQYVLQRWYVKKNTYHVKEMHQDLQAIGRAEMSIPMIKSFIQNKDCVIDIDRALFPLIDGNYDLISDLARLDNKITLRRYVHYIPAQNIEYKMALVYQFSHAFDAEDYYQLFSNYIDPVEFYSQYHYVESLLSKPQALLETLGTVTQHSASVEQPEPSAPQDMLMTPVATAVYASDAVGRAATSIYAVAVPCSASLDLIQDATQQKENSHASLSKDNPQTKQPAEEQHVFEPPSEEKDLVAQKILLAFAKVSIEKITCPEAIMTLTRQLKNDWLAYHFIQKSIDLMYQWAKVSVLFLEIHQTNGQVNPKIMQFINEDSTPPEKGFAAAWKSTSSLVMSTIGFSTNKYALFYTDICSKSKAETDHLKMKELVKAQSDIASELGKMLQPT